tara:strand:+ start:803 stop:952 length:150 start_codon:yes stop_codon:yes gene_type:complete
MHRFDEINITLDILLVLILGNHSFFFNGFIIDQVPLALSHFSFWVLSID